MVNMFSNDLLGKYEAQLQAAGVENAARELRWMHEALVDRGADEAANTLANWVLRRCGGEPLQYIMGCASFFESEFFVGPGVLIPRPETEQLVELCLERIPRNGVVCDLCTGSGAIALSIGRARPDVLVEATDLSEEALGYAKRNLHSLGLKNVTLHQGDLWGPVDGQSFDLVVSNPPYISSQDYATLDRTVRDWEPKMALEAAENGLFFYRRIAEKSSVFLKKAGYILCELGEEQARAAAFLFEQQGLSVEIRKDYQGKNRFLIARKG